MRNKWLLFIVCFLIFLSGCEELKDLLGLKEEVIVYINKGTVTGKVTDYDGNSIADSYVKLTPSTLYTQPMETPVKTDANGEFRIEEVPPGAHTIIFSKTGDFISPTSADLNYFFNGGYEVLNDYNSVWVDEGKETRHDMKICKVDLVYFQNLAQFFIGGWLAGDEPTCLLAQEFKPTSNKLRKLTILKSTLFPVEIRPDNSGNPGNTVLVSAIPVREILEDYDVYRVDFSSYPVTVTPENSYWIVSHQQSIIYDDNIDLIPTLATKFSTDNGATWNSIVTYDDGITISSTPIDNSFITYY
jgi:hypothetical protein